MTTKDARMIWLLTLGSGWVGLRDLFMGSDEVLLAYKTLLNTAEFEYDQPKNIIKIKCKS
jgi:hypothetical protein